MFQGRVFGWCLVSLDKTGRLCLTNWDTEASAREAGECRERGGFPTMGIISGISLVGLLANLDKTVVPASDTECCAHLAECFADPCDICNGLLEFFATCDRCGKWSHKSVLVSVNRDGVVRNLCGTCDE